MARGPRFRVAFRRRRLGKTDYRKRLALLLSRKPRFVVRITGKHVITQIVNFDFKGDKTICAANSLELKKQGWKAHTNNTPSAYLTGYLCGLRARKKGIKKAVFDIGLREPKKGARVFAALKGGIDAGLTIPHDESTFPSEERISGKHIVEYVKVLKNPKKVFANYYKNGLNPSELPNHFMEIKKVLEKSIK